jgi:5'-nucleotidase (lipoprotein e(P4) family)
MNTLLKAGLWLLVSITVDSFPYAVFAQAPGRAEEYKSPPPHLHANLWMQTSAEYQALCRQTFNAALREIKQTVKEAKRHQGRPVGPDRKPLAVVADLDETILDNARFQSEMDAAVWADGMDIGYTFKRWEQWERGNAEEVGLVPGAGPFISEVEKLKVVMVYISNRLESLKDSTVRALAHNGINTQGLQGGTELRLLLKPERSTSNKQERISQVDEKYHVVAYLGDNLGDFPGGPEQPQDVAQQLAARRNHVESAGDLWGTRWFMLPNPVYGSWDQILPKTVKERMDLLKRASNPAFVDAK